MTDPIGTAQESPYLIPMLRNEAQGIREGHPCADQGLLDNAADALERLSERRIGTAQELIEHARKLRTDLCEALPNGVGNTIDALADALRSRIAEGGRLTEVLRRIERKLSNGLANDALDDARAALSLQRRV